MTSRIRRRAAITKTMMIGVMVVLTLLLQLLMLHGNKRSGAITVVDAFCPALGATTTSIGRKERIPTRLSCICVNCKWVTSCKAYHFVEKKHEQPHMSEEPTFLPREGSPTINVNIRTEQRVPKTKAGVIEKQKPQMWKDQIEDDDINEPKRDAKYYEETGTIETVRTNTTTTIEYDIVKCADFSLEKGCWVRNMPEEIRRVNPDFVPT